MRGRELGVSQAKEGVAAHFRARVFAARTNGCLVPSDEASHRTLTSRIFDEKEVPMRNLLLRFWTDDQGQDIAE
jgi:hypothetical protein